MTGWKAHFYWLFHMQAAGTVSAFWVCELTNPQVQTYLKSPKGPAFSLLSFIFPLPLSAFLCCGTVAHAGSSPSLGDGDGGIKPSYFHSVFWKCVLEPGECFWVAPHPAEQSGIKEPLHTQPRVPGSLLSLNTQVMMSPVHSQMERTCSPMTLPSQPLRRLCANHPWIILGEE